VPWLLLLADHVAVFINVWRRLAGGIRCVGGGSGVITIKVNPAPTLAMTELTGGNESRDGG
jgi:hypothetical protein